MEMSSHIYGSAIGCVGNGRNNKGDKHIGTNYEGCMKSCGTFIVNSSINLALMSIKFL